MTFKEVLDHLKRGMYAKRASWRHSQAIGLADVYRYLLSREDTLATDWEVINCS